MANARSLRNDVRALALNEHKLTKRSASLVLLGKAMKRERPLKLNNYIKFLYRHSKRNSKYKIPYSKSSLE